jgi:hypothetical protein
MHANLRDVESYLPGDKLPKFVNTDLIFNAVGELPFSAAPVGTANHSSVYGTCP